MASSLSSLMNMLLFPPPPSLIINATSAITAASLCFIGISEVAGKHLNYSKFWNAGISARTGWRSATVSSRAGMFLLYAPAAAAAAASFFLPGAVVGTRAHLVSAALAVHFLKRVLEVLFIHQYSGRMLLDTALIITFSYTTNTIAMIYAQYLTQGMPEPTLNLEIPGLILFLIGLAGNFYHHYILSNLRKNGDKSYKIPKGGLFGLVICPHYLFEILVFYGVAMIAQTVFACAFAVGTTGYLVGRSVVTRKWYKSKFEDFPKEVKALVPFVF